MTGPIPKPQPRGTLKPATLRHPEVRAAMRRLLASKPSPEPDSADALWSQVLEIDLAHQRAQAKERLKQKKQLKAEETRRGSVVARSLKLSA